MSNYVDSITIRIHTYIVLYTYSNVSTFSYLKILLSQKLRRIYRRVWGRANKNKKKMVYMCIENVTAITKNKINIKTLEINIVIIVINAISIHNK